MKEAIIMWKITPIPAFNDNYIWAIHNNTDCIVVDPGTAKPVQSFLRETRLALAGILVTHHHPDHVGGILDLLKEWHVPVFGPDNPEIKGISNIVGEGATISIKGKFFSVNSTPGHTLDHIVYVAPDEKALFCGDTLFGAGCGRIFEGTPSMLYGSLQKLASLPADTRVYCAHEYTLSNLRFALEVEPENPEIQRRFSDCVELRNQGQPTLPSTIAEELLTNPFLRVDITAVITQTLNQGACSDSPVDVFTCLREWKNQF